MNEIVKTETDIGTAPHYNLGSVQVIKPSDVIQIASGIATELAKIIKDKKLYKMINNKAHVYVEAWTTAGALLGIVPLHRPEFSKQYEDGGFEETVDLVRVIDGVRIGSGTAICGTQDEPTWNKHPMFQRKSMAITRATGKAFRLNLSWIMILAGYEATPAEEMEIAEFTELKNTKPTESIDENHITQQRWLAILKTAREQQNFEGAVYGSDKIFAMAKAKFGIKTGRELTIQQADELENVLKEFASQKPEAENVTA